MRAENIDFNITIPFPINNPDVNGVVYTKEAVEDAIKNIDEYLPISFYVEQKDEVERCEDICIGTIHNKDITTRIDEELGICYVTFHGKLFGGGTVCNAEFNDETKTVHWFHINGIGISND